MFEFNYEGFKKIQIQENMEKLAILTIQLIRKRKNQEGRKSVHKRIKRKKQKTEKKIMKARQEKTCVDVNGPGEKSLPTLRHHLQLEVHRVHAEHHRQHYCSCYLPSKSGQEI